MVSCYVSLHIALSILYCTVEFYDKMLIIPHGGSSVRTLALETATIQLKPPEPFNFKTPDEWPCWRRRFEQFRVASGLAEESATKQVSTLLYCLGEEAESVLTSMNPTDANFNVYLLKCVVCCKHLVKGLLTEEWGLQYEW